MQSRFLTTLLLPTTLVLAALTSAPATIIDFSASNQGWTAELESGPSSLGPFQWGTPSDGGGNAWYTDGVPDSGEFDVGVLQTLTSPQMTITTGGPLTVEVTHRFNFETVDIGSGDGGQVRYRVNGVGPWLPAELQLLVPASAFTPPPLTPNGYNSTAIPGLNGGPGWNGQSAGFGTPVYITSTAHFGSFTVGDKIELRLRAGWNDLASPPGPDWVIGSVTVDNAVPEPATYAVVCGVGLLGFSAWRRTRR